MTKCKVLGFLNSLVHLLFLRIHPYTDGNGRTARILHNIKFTEMINKVYSTRLKLSPLNYIRKYISKQNNIRKKNR